MSDRLWHTQIRYKFYCCLCFVFPQDAAQAQVAQENGAVFAGGVELIQPVSLFLSSYKEQFCWLTAKSGFHISFFKHSSLHWTVSSVWLTSLFILVTLFMTKWIKMLSPSDKLWSYIMRKLCSISYCSGDVQGLFNCIVRRSGTAQRVGHLSPSPQIKW